MFLAIEWIGDCVARLLGVFLDYDYAQVQCLTFLEILCTVYKERLFYIINEIQGKVKWDKGFECVSLSIVVRDAIKTSSTYNAIVPSFAPASVAAFHAI